MTLSFQDGHDGGGYVASANGNGIWKSKLLYLYCVDPGYVSELTIPFLKLKCCLDT